MGSGIPNLKEEYQGGNSLHAVPATDLSAAMAFINAIGSLDAENMVLEVSANGKQVRLAVNFSLDDFDVDPDSKLITTSGATGSADSSNTLTIVNGRVTNIA